MDTLYQNNDIISNENCSEVKRSLQLNTNINSKTMISDKSKSSKRKGKSSRSKQSEKTEYRTPKSYFSKFYPVTTKQYAYLAEIVKSNSPSEKETFYQVYQSEMRPENLKEDNSIPIPSPTLRKKFPNDYPKMQLLIEQNKLELAVSYSIEDGICNEYKIPREILEQSVSKELLDDEVYVNLFTGKSINAARKSVLTYGKNKLKLPNIVYLAIKGIKRTYFNLEALDKYIQQLHDAHEKGFKTNKQYRKYINDLNCHKSIMRNVVNLENGIGYYVPSYESQKPGRITELEGRLQSCSRAMKKVAFTFTLNSRKCRNYDLKSSQVYILKWWFEKAGISTEWLDNYLVLDKKKWADSIGIPIKCFKNCMYAKFMGAEFIEDAGKYWDKKAGKYKPEFFCRAIAKYLLEEAQKTNQCKGIFNNSKADEKRMLELLERFNKFIKPLQKQLNKFYEWLKYDYCQKNNYNGIVKNLTGMSFDLKEYEKKDKNGNKIYRSEIDRKLTSFFLQGTEAAFIHYLTKTEIQQKYNYEVINNAHDGLVTIGVVPEAATVEARKAIGLPYAYLEEKEICSSEEENWWLT